MGGLQDLGPLLRHFVLLFVLSVVLRIGSHGDKLWPPRRRDVHPEVLPERVRGGGAVLLPRLRSRWHARVHGGGAARPPKVFSPIVKSQFSSSAVFYLPEIVKLNIFKYEVTLMKMIGMRCTAQLQIILMHNVRSYIEYNKSYLLWLAYFTQPSS